VDWAVVVLAEEVEIKSSVSPKKSLQKGESPSGKIVLQKMQSQLESLKKKINSVNGDVQKYVYHFS